MISIDAFKVSWLYQEGLDEGKAEGEAKGLLEGKRAALRLALATKFPTEQFPEVDQLQQPEALDHLLLVAIKADGADQVRAAMLALVRPN